MSKMQKQQKRNSNLFVRNPELKGMSYSQAKRAKMNYRKEYFAHNPGLFGVVWSCAYCHAPLCGRHNVVVDHIVPLNNPLGQNKRYNLVASCQACNSAKSDIVDMRVIQGYFSKIVWSIIFGIQKLIIIALVALWSALLFILKGIKSLLIRPYQNTSFMTKCIVTLVYVMLVYFLFIR